MQNYDQAKHKAMELAKTAEGQQLIEMLRQTGGHELKNAMEKAASGDFSQVQQVLSQLMENPETKKMLDKMGW